MTARKKPMSWRDHISIHPAAEVFPLMSVTELGELARDIRTNGLQSPVVVWDQPSLEGSEQLVLCGRNRLDAMERAGITVLTPEGRLQPALIRVIADMSSSTAAALVIAENIRRRHLTPKQRADLAAAAIAADKAFLKELAQVTPTLPKSTVGRDQRGRVVKGGRSPNRSEVADVAEAAGVSVNTARKAVRDHQAAIAEAKPNLTVVKDTAPKASTKKPAKKPTPKKPPARAIAIADFLTLIRRTKGSDLSAAEIRALTQILTNLKRIASEKATQNYG